MSIQSPVEELKTETKKAEGPYELNRFRGRFKISRKNRLI